MKIRLSVKDSSWLWCLGVFGVWHLKAEVATHSRRGYK